MLSNAQQCSAMLSNAQQCSAMLSNAPHWDFFFNFFPNLCYTSFEKSKYVIKNVYIYLFFIHEWINDILGFVIDYEKMPLGGSSSSKPPKIEQKLWYFHYQDEFRDNMGVKISGIHHRIQIYWFGARPFSLGGARLEKPCKNGVFCGILAVFGRFFHTSYS